MRLLQKEVIRRLAVRLSAACRGSPTQKFIGSSGIRERERAGMFAER
jgi:hypothetical protein